MLNDQNDSEAKKPENEEGYSETEKYLRASFDPDDITRWKQYPPHEFVIVMIHELLERSIHIKAYLEVLEKYFENAEPIQVTPDTDAHHWISSTLMINRILERIIRVIQEYWRTVPKDWPEK